MKVKITIEGHDLLKSQVFDELKQFYEDQAECEAEYEHESGDMVTIEEVTVDGDTLIVTLNEPEEEPEE